MDMTIRTRNLDLTERVQAYVQRKLDKLSRYPFVAEARVELARQETRSQEDRMAVQVTLNCNGIVLRGEERAQDIMAAVDRVSDVLERRLERYKAKLYRKGKGNQPQPTPIPDAQETQDAPRIVKTKRFAMKPMIAEEAADQMEFLGHQFFLFYNAASQQYNVLYKREDGDYGLIEPELL